MCQVKVGWKHAKSPLMFNNNANIRCEIYNYRYPEVRPRKPEEHVISERCRAPGIHAFAPPRVGHFAMGYTRNGSQSLPHTKRMPLAVEGLR